MNLTVSILLGGALCITGWSVMAESNHDPHYQTDHSHAQHAQHQGYDAYHGQHAQHDRHQLIAHHSQHDKAQHEQHHGDDDGHHYDGHDAHHHDHHHDAHSHVDYSAEFAAAALAEGVVIEQCWLRLLPAHVPSAGYFLLSNQSDEPLELLAAQTDSYDLLMLHQTYEEDGLLKMKMADKLDIAAGAQLNFEPGGLHMMFEEPTTALSVGDNVDIEFLFKNPSSQSLTKKTVSCRVNPAKARRYDETQ